MKIIKRETNNGQGQQTLLLDELTKKYYVVSSVHNAFANETYIFESDRHGNITNWSEVWGIRPRDHYRVVNQLVTKELTSLDFYEVNL
jgi:hypothetical protein